MNILHVEMGRHLYGGAYQSLLLLEHLQQRGIQGHLVVPDDSDVLREAQRRNLPTLPIRYGGDTDARLAFRIRDLCEHFPVDIVHVHSRRGADVWGGLGARMANKPALLTRRVDNPEIALTLRAKLSMYDQLVAISTPIQALLSPLHRQPVQLIHSAVPPPVQAPSPREIHRAFDIAPGRRVLGMVAQLIPRKGHYALFDALERLPEGTPDCHALLFGQGPLHTELADYVEDRKLSDRVSFCGFRDDLHEWLPQLDALVHPALAEGLGVAVLQACQHAVPVVCTNAGGLVDIIRDGETGWQVNVGDVAGLSRAIHNVLTRPIDARQRAEQARDMVKQFFSADNMADDYVQVYEALLQRRKKAAA